MATVQADARPAKLNRSQTAAVARAARALGALAETRDAYTKIARAIVSLRMTFEKDGRPDFRGETPQYRGAIASLYENAVPDPMEREAFKVTIRYWVGKEFQRLIHAGELTMEELEEAGIHGRNGGTGGAEGARPHNVPDLEEIFARAEQLVRQEARRNAKSVIPAIQHVDRELELVIETLRVEKVPGRALSNAAESLLTRALEAAHLSGIEVEDFVSAWWTQVLDTERAAAV